MHTTRKQSKTERPGLEKLSRFLSKAPINIFVFHDDRYKTNLNNH